MRVVCFQTLGEPFALPVEAVRSVVRGGARRALPGREPWVVGVADVRSSLVPVVDLGLRLGRGPTGLEGDLVVVEVGEESVVVPVDRVLGLETLAGVAPPPPGAGEAVAGVALVGSRLVVVLDARALMPGGAATGGELVLDESWDGDPAVFDGRPGVEALRVLARDAEDLSGVHDLRALRELEIRSRDRTPIDLRAFPRLERVALRWRPGAVLSSASVRELELTHYGAKDLRGLAGLPALRSLSLEFGPLERVDGVEALTALEDLRLRNLRRLSSVDGVGARVRVSAERCPRLSGRA